MLVLIINNNIYNNYYYYKVFAIICLSNLFNQNGKNRVPCDENLRLFGRWQTELFVPKPAVGVGVLAACKSFFN